MSFESQKRVLGCCFLPFENRKGWAPSKSVGSCLG